MTAETAESAPVIPIPETDGFTGNKVYFAAPLFSEAEREYNLYLTEILESYGYEVFLPQLDMDLNPMIVGCLTYLFYDVNGDDHIVELEEYLETNPL